MCPHMLLLSRGVYRGYPHGTGVSYKALYYHLGYPTGLVCIHLPLAILLMGTCVLVMSCVS